MTPQVRAALIASGVVALLVWWRSSAQAAAAPPVVAGVVSSGSRTVVIDTNVLSPTFGQVINPLTGVAIELPHAPPEAAARGFVS